MFLKCDVRVDDIMMEAPKDFRHNVQRRCYIECEEVYLDVDKVGFSQLFSITKLKAFLDTFGSGFVFIQCDINIVMFYLSFIPYIFGNTYKYIRSYDIFFTVVNTLYHKLCNIISIVCSRIISCLSMLYDTIHHK